MFYYVFVATLIDCFKWARSFHRSGFGGSSVNSESNGSVETTTETEVNAGRGDDEREASYVSDDAHDKQD